MVLPSELLVRSVAMNLVDAEVIVPSLTRTLRMWFLPALHPAEQDSLWTLLGLAFLKNCWAGAKIWVCESWLVWLLTEVSPRGTLGCLLVANSVSWSASTRVRSRVFELGDPRT